MKCDKPMDYDFDAICAKCKSEWGCVIHCRACCGWGMTAHLKAHKFVRAQSTPTRKPKGGRP